MRGERGAGRFVNARDVSRHFEIRVGDDYLGDWLEGDQLVRVITRAFD